MKQRRAIHLFAAATFTLAAAFAASAAGCSSGHGEEGCPELCEAQTACSASTMTEDECMSQCGALEETAETKGCEESWTDLLECWSHAEDPCDAEAFEAECTVQAQAHESCLKGS